jgi:hypothetical protein
MDADFETEWHPSTKLNAIGSALDFGRSDPLPDNVTRDEIEEYCYTLEQLYGDYVDRVAAETALSRREATTWVLRNLVYEGADRLTFDAVGLYIWAVGRATEGDPLSRTIVADYADRAREKITDAEATVAFADAPPYPEDLFDDPTMLWVEGSVADRLARRLGREDAESYSDVIAALLDESVDGVDIETLVDAYRTEREATFVGVQTARPDWDRELPLTVRVPANDRPAESVPTGEAVVVDGHPYPYAVEERAVGVGTEAALPLFDADAGIDPEAGIERLVDALDAVESTLPDLVERAHEAGAAGLAVADGPAGAGVHLLVVDGPAEPFDVVERVALVDRTLGVGRVEAVTGEAFADRSATLLWASGEGTLDAASLPDDPVERRDRLPTPVLRTG